MSASARAAALPALSWHGQHQASRRKSEMRPALNVEKSKELGNSGIREFKKNTCDADETLSLYRRLGVYMVEMPSGASTGATHPASKIPRMPSKNAPHPPLALASLGGRACPTNHVGQRKKSALRE